MAHRWSIAHLSALELGPSELIAAAAEAGCDFVGLRVSRTTPGEPGHPLLEDPVLRREVRLRCADTGVGVHDLEVIRLAPRAEARDFLPMLDVAAELGCRGIIAQVHDADIGRAAQKLALLAEEAGSRGLRLELEHLTWGELPDFASAARLAADIDHPALGLLVDFLHFDRSGDDLDALRAVPRQRLALAHACDAPAERPTTTEALVHAARSARLAPGDGGLDVRGLVAALPDDVVLALEVPNDALRARLGPIPYLRRLVSRARAHIDA